MELTNQYKKGILKLAILLGLLCFFIGVCKWYPSSESGFVLNQEAQCFIDNQELILAEAKNKKQYTYYVNSISDYSGYKLGLSVAEIDSLIAYRKKGNKVYTLNQFKEVSGISDLKLDSIKNLLVFPKIKTKKTKKVFNKSLVKLVKSDINKVTSKELKYKLKFSWKMANRIINYRKKLGEFKSMDQLSNVYFITDDQLKLLNDFYEIGKQKSGE